MPTSAGAPIDPAAVEAFASAFLVLLAPALSLMFVFALAHCLLGYFIFRVDLVLAGLGWGAFLGWMVLLWLRPAATGTEAFVSCVLASCLLALAAWFLYRPAFALLSAAAVLAVFLRASPTPTTGWVFGGLFAAGAAVLAFLFTKAIWIFLSAAVGAAVSVASAAAVIAGVPRVLSLTPAGLAERQPLLAALAGIAAALAAAGMFIQHKLSRRLRITLVREAPDKKKPPARKKGAAAAKTTPASDTRR